MSIKKGGNFENFGIPIFANSSTRVVLLHNIQKMFIPICLTAWIKLLPKTYVTYEKVYMILILIQNLLMQIAKLRVIDRNQKPQNKSENN